MPLINRPCVTPGVEVGKATLPLTYSQGLEYSAPARGTWTIMHLGLLIPDAHHLCLCKVLSERRFDVRGGTAGHGPVFNDHD